MGDSSKKLSEVGIVGGTQLMAVHCQPEVWQICDRGLTPKTTRVCFIRGACFLVQYTGELEEKQWEVCSGTYEEQVFKSISALPNKDYDQLVHVRIMACSWNQ